MPALGYGLYIARPSVDSGGGQPSNIYLRPGGVDNYFRPDGTSYYIRP